MNEDYKEAARRVLTAEAAERYIGGDMTATDDAGHELIQDEVIKITAERCELNATTDYNQASRNHVVAASKYRMAATAYRSLMIGDAEFIASCEEMKLADAKFDAAFNLEQSRGS